MHGMTAWAYGQAKRILCVCVYVRVLVRVCAVRVEWTRAGVGGYTYFVRRAGQPGPSVRGRSPCKWAGRAGAGVVVVEVEEYLG
jgi:hypothetical protein